jgi:hypothetical protein
MQRATARYARLLGGTIALSALLVCAAGSGGEPDFAKVFTTQGLMAGTDSFARCVERQQLQQQMELERIRQAREAARGGTRL